jgi:hypothetical protein
MPKSVWILEYMFLLRNEQMIHLSASFLPQFLLLFCLLRLGNHDETEKV